MSYINISPALTSC